MMRIKSVCFYLSICLLGPNLCAQAEERILGVGEQDSFPIEAGTKFSIGNPEVLSARNLRIDEERNMLLVRAKRSGYSDLVLISSGQNRKISYRVGGKKTISTERNLSAAIRRAGNLEVIPGEGKVVVRGEAAGVDELNLVQSMADPSPRGVVNLARLNPLARDGAAAKIRLVLAGAGLDGIRVKTAGDRIWLEGELAHQEDAELALALAREVFLSAASRIKVPFEQEGVVRFRVRILELVKSGNHSTGVLWNTSVPKIVSIHQRLTKGTVSLDATLNLLARKGFARMLSEPVITVNSRGQAELRVGGEFPVPLKTKNQMSVVWKPYGLSLKIEVPGSGKNLVRTKMAVEVSSIDPSNAIEGIPGIKLNKMDTTVDLRKSRTIFLSGLLEDQRGESLQGLPLLMDIPIFGALFRSRDFQERRTELVIAITAEDSNGSDESE
jgi:Flp pilus assembly secretin CpaC